MVKGIPTKLMKRAGIVLPIILSVTLVLGSVYTLSSTPNGHSQIASAVKGKHSSSASNAIQLSAKEVTHGVYNWINGSNGAANPTLKVLANSKSVIKIQNPTDTKHELIIDTGADVLPSSDDINPNGSGQLSFSPNMTGTFTYHCAYHPFTMKGTIQVVNAP